MEQSISLRLTWRWLHHMHLVVQDEIWHVYKPSSCFWLRRITHLIWNPSHARICPQKSLKLPNLSEVCLHCHEELALWLVVWCICWGSSDGSQTCRKYCPLGHQKDDGQGTGITSDATMDIDGPRTWLVRLSHGPLWLQCSDREVFRCASMCCHQAMTISRLPKADHKPWRSRCMACSTTKHLKNLSAAIPPSHHRFNVHRWDTAIQLLLENSARKKSFCIAIMAIESDQCFKGSGALAFVFTGLLTIKTLIGLGTRTSKKWVFAIGALHCQTPAPSAVHTVTWCRVRVHSTGNDYAK